MKKRRFKSRNLTRDVVVVAFAFSILLIGIVAYFASQVKRDISEQYIDNASKRVATEFQGMVGRVESSLGMVRDWGGSGLVDLSDTEKLKELLLPFFGKERMLAGISVADSEGRSYFILSDGTISQPSKDKLYDSMQRPWFAPALKADGFYWTEIYRFFTLDEYGVTASVSWPDKSGKGLVVAAFDILLEDFFGTIQEMAPTASSRAFIFQPDGRLYIPDSESSQSEFQSVELIKDQLAKRSLSIWWSDDMWLSDDMEIEAAPYQPEVVKMFFEGAAWWCGFVPLEKARRNVWLGLLVPESDIVGDIARRRKILFGIGIVVVLAVLALSVFFIWRIRSRELQLGDDISAEDVQSLIAKGENRYVEFKSTLRMNLHSKKPGKEIELAWLKGVAAFLNTDGGTLLLGVTDAGEITGLEQDVFENEDKCRLHFKNLIAAHIGAELSKHIRFVLVPVEGKTVGIVHCSRSAEPVFLKNGNKEAFYIRNGPSSDELPVSKALKYIKHRS